ncbi:IS1634 family transposase [Pelosinus propionicus]|uniref:Transposase n=1 Tax=Pelosinus propionicus DSM 13327 TaxID=1123291 RepID=A0A1I4K7S4_9FIRM|nr:transposase [Pelosinus propionicus]SFL74536.1 Transposase [Pelosinus propionicus DSM 13327]
MPVRGTQNINGTEYVYEYISIWNSTKKRSEQKRNYIGKNVEGIFLPNKKYTLQQQLEHATAETEIKPEPVPAAECKRLFYGAIYLLDSIGQATGVTEDLKQCFPADYKEILSLAYFLVLEENTPIYRFHRWAVTHVHPFRFNIPSQHSTKLFGRIQEEQKMKFFALQSKRRFEQEYLAYDTTSISSFSQGLTYGSKKEHGCFQLDLALLYGESSRLPVYYRKLPGSITDVKTVETLVKDIDFLKMEKLNLVMDRSFYSEANINELFRKHHKFLIGVKTSLKLVRNKLDEIRDDFVSRQYYNSENQLYIRSFTQEWDYMETKSRTGEVITDKRRIYVHYYYNDQLATDDKKRFNQLLDTLEEELLSGRKKTKHEKLYQKYYDVLETPVRGRKVVPKQDAISQAEKNYGFFVLLSNGIKDPVAALKLFRTKDLIENAFGDLKERLNLCRISAAAEENLEDKLFVQFVALIYISYIKKAMEDNGLLKKYTMKELLDELDIIEYYHQYGNYYHLSEITEKQKKLYHYMKVEPPT